MFRLCGTTYRWRTKTWIKMTREYRQQNIEDKVKGRPKNWYKTNERYVKLKKESRFKLYKSRATGSKFTWKGSVLNTKFSLNMGGYYWQEKQ